MFIEIKKYKYRAIGCIVVFFIITPAVLEYGIFRNRFVSVISNEAWGNIFASLVGSFFSFIVAAFAFKISLNTLELSKKGGIPNIILNGSSFFKDEEKGFKEKYINVYNIGQGFAKNIEITYCMDKNKLEQFCREFNLNIVLTENFIEVDGRVYVMSNKPFKLNFMAPFEKTSVTHRVALPEAIFETYRHVRNKVYEFRPFPKTIKCDITDTEEILRQSEEYTKKFNKVWNLIEKDLDRFNEIFKLRCKYHDLSFDLKEDNYDLLFDSNGKVINTEFKLRKQYRNTENT